MRDDPTGWLIRLLKGPDLARCLGIGLYDPKAAIREEAESCGSQISDGKNEKSFVLILQAVRFSMTLRTDIFLYTEKLAVMRNV